MPFYRLLAARIGFGKNADAAIRDTDDILTFSRLNQNRLHLVGASLQKAWMQMQAQGEQARREVNNLLREALHYAWENRILMPYYLERKRLTPLLARLAQEAVGRNALSPNEDAFLRDVLALCQPAQKAEKSPDGLTARELEVLRALARGLTNREIADGLCISLATVKTHVLSVFGKLGVSSRLMAIQAARERGLIA